MSFVLATITSMTCIPTNIPVRKKNQQIKKNDYNPTNFNSSQKHLPLLREEILNVSLPAALSKLQPALFNVKDFICVGIYHDQQIYIVYKNKKDAA